MRNSLCVRSGRLRALEDPPRRAWGQGEPRVRATGGRRRREVQNPPPAEAPLSQGRESSRPGSPPCVSVYCQHGGPELCGPPHAAGTTRRAPAGNQRASPTPAERRRVSAPCCPWPRPGPAQGPDWLGPGAGLARWPPQAFSHWWRRRREPGSGRGRRRRRRRLLRRAGVAARSSTRLVRRVARQPCISRPRARWGTACGTGRSCSRTSRASR